MDSDRSRGENPAEWITRPKAGIQARRKRIERVKGWRVRARVVEGEEATIIMQARVELSEFVNTSGINKA